MFLFFILHAWILSGHTSHSQTTTTEFLFLNVPTWFQIYWIQLVRQTKKLKKRAPIRLLLFQTPATNSGTTFTSDEETTNLRISISTLRLNNSWDSQNSQKTIVLMVMFITGKGHTLEPARGRDRHFTLWHLHDDVQSTTPQGSSLRHLASKLFVRA